MAFAAGAAFIKTSLRLLMRYLITLHAARNIKNLPSVIDDDDDDDTDRHLRPTSPAKSMKLLSSPLCLPSPISALDSFGLRARRLNEICLEMVDNSERLIGC